LIIECEPRLVPLFERSFRPAQVHSYRAISEGGRVFVSYDWLPVAGGADLMLEIGSLPRLLKPNLDCVPEVYAPLVPCPEEIENWRHWLNTLGTKPKIGVCWRSGKLGGLRDVQYAPIALWRAFLASIDAEFVMCQYDERSEEIAELESSGRQLHIPPGLDQKNEIDRLAGLLAGLDAVVCAPTAVSVLAAAVGTPTLKLTFAGTWTAFGREREPFLPASQIIRPRQAGDWAEAFSLAAQALALLVPAGG
jgi:ADP-heptose:LPS heptosyltransferase